MPHGPGTTTLRLAGRILRHAVRAIAYGVVVALLIIIVGVVVVLERRPDLHPWHTVHLNEEFTAKASLKSFDEYLALEDRLFKQLDEQVYAPVPADPDMSVDRYRHGTLADPGRWPTNWNRSFQLSAPEAKAGALLLHGMSDSPYSMRSLGQSLHADGVTVLAMRVPGHGTAPSGLVRVRWQDMAAAVELAMRHLAAQVPDAPLYIMGYSNGGALAVHYALTTLEDPSLPRAQGLVLMSPEIGITKLAAVAAWQERLGHLLGLEKLSWNSIEPEYDPFQYKSFALNAAKQAHLITGEIQERITRLEEKEALSGFPSLLAFQSIVDATVEARVLVSGLFERLPKGNHELVVFDLNRVATIEHLLKRDPRPAMEKLLDRTDLTFTVTMLTNEDPQSHAVVTCRHQPGDASPAVSPLDLAWPKDLYSLARIALPFPPDDPVYGGPDASKSPGVHLGNLIVRGEKGVLQVSAGTIMRVHWNPFFPYLEQRTLEFVVPSAKAGSSPGSDP